MNAITDAYTYLHFPLIAGVIIAALGIETAMHEVAGEHPLGIFGAAALGGGLALYLSTAALVWVRVSGQWSLIRFGTATLCVLAIPLIAALPALAGLAIVAVLLLGSIAIEEAFGPRVKLASRVTRRRGDPAAP